MFFSVTVPMWLLIVIFMLGGIFTLGALYITIMIYMIKHPFLG